MEEMLKHSLAFAPPLMNAAGSLGFYPDPHAPLDWAQFGAFVTNPISRKARKPTSQVRWADYPGGMLLHSGHPNPGFSAVLHSYARRWAQAPLPMVVHLLAGSPKEMAEMMLRLEELENIAAIEVGFPETIEKTEAIDVVQAALGELALIARLPLHKAAMLANLLVQAGVAAISLGPPRGSLPASGSRRVSGRLYGPGIFPLALQVVNELAQSDVPVIGAGGVYQPEQVTAMLAAGAIAVQLDTALWRGGWPQIDFD